MNKAAVFFLLFIITATGYGQPVQLAPPLLKYKSVFFEDKTTVELLFAQKSTAIHYTLNDEQPTERDKVYAKPIQIKNSITTLKAIATGDGFLPSEPVSVTFIKQGLKVKSIQQSEANKRFPGSGTNTLIDNEGGITDLNSKTWLGYQQDSVEIELQLEHKQKISSVLIHCLQDQGSWIFLPEQIDVAFFDERTHVFKWTAGQYSPVQEVIVPGATCQPIIIKMGKNIITEKIRIVVKGVHAIPELHPGKGTPGWLFIDEIKLY
jgi:Fn3 associated